MFTNSDKYPVEHSVLVETRKIDKNISKYKIYFITFIKRLIIFYFK